jgi:CSLREA domain-containing protein
MKQLPLILDIFLLILVLPFGATTARAKSPPPPVTSYTVTSTADTTDGVCNVTNCTLREAIVDANANAYAGSVSILFSVNGRITLTSLLPSPNRGALGLNINATTHDIVISGNDTYQIMDNPPTSVLTLLNLIFAQGYTIAEGGAIKIWEI